MSPPRNRRESRPGLAADLGIGGAAVLGAAGLAVAAGLPAAFPVVASAAYVGIAAYVLAGLGRAGMRAPFGAANRVTLSRGVIAAILAGSAAAAPALSPAELWLLAGLGAIGLLLDGIDGRIARATGTAGRFGAGFDMEVDALTILLLSLLLWRIDRADAWVLAIGAMRYVFLAAGAVLPPLRRPLPPRRRRQAICALQMLALLACLPPLLPEAARQAMLASALAALAASFAADIVWLVRNRRDPAEAADDAARFAKSGY